MATETDVTCPSCHTPFRGTPVRTFLGFQKLTCPSCKNQVVYPLTPGFRITYWVLVALMAVAIGINLSQGRIGFPGVLGILVIIALIRDWQIRKQLAAGSTSARVK